jgi:hypothetical protein
VPRVQGVGVPRRGPTCAGCADVHRSSQISTTRQSIQIFSLGARGPLVLGPLWGDYGGCDLRPPLELRGELLAGAAAETAASITSELPSSSSLLEGALGERGSQPKPPHAASIASGHHALFSTAKRARGWGVRCVGVGVLGDWCVRVPPPPPP